jgi:hypothetical protein
MDVAMQTALGQNVKVVILTVAPHCKSTEDRPMGLMHAWHDDIS